MSNDFATLNGVKIAIDKNCISPKILEVIAKGSYEQKEAKQIPGIVQQGERVVELGGGLGYISTIVAKQNKAESIVVYEANPDLIPLIERTHELNGVKATVVNAVVLPKKKTETVPFYVRDQFWASSLAPDVHGGYQRVVEVPVVSFEEMLEKDAPTMLIVDIEGGEVSLFRDVPMTGIRKVYMELHQPVIGRVAMKRIFDFFSSKDFHYDQWHSSQGVVLFSHVLRK